MHAEEETLHPDGASTSKSFTGLYGNMILLVIITAAGAFLRFYHLRYNSLWLDEGATYELSRFSFLHTWNTMATGEFNPPLFFWMEHLMLPLGKNESVLRLIPAMLGTLTIPLVYLVGRELNDGCTGAAAASIVAFSPFHIFYSQEARAYTTVLFFLTCALFFFLRAWKSGSCRCWAAFGIFSALSFYTHFYSALLITALALLGAVSELWLRERSIQRIKGFSAGLLLSLLMVLPLLAIAVPLAVRRTTFAPTWGLRGFEALAVTVTQMLNSNSAVAVILTAASILGIVLLWRRNRMSALILSVSLVVPLAATPMLSYRMPFHPRYLIYLLPLFAIAIACAASPLFSRRRWTVVIFIVMIVFLSLAPLKEYYTHFSKEDWRTVAAQFRSIHQDNDVYVFMPGYISLPFLFYYQGPEERIVKMNSYRDEDFESLLHTLPDKRLLFIVTADIKAVHMGENALRWVNSHAQYYGERTGIHIFVMETRPQ
ncbi:MAG: glycosyltransferase family 39 protein [Candidatus Xenobiia bacterium LiM19]